MQTDARVGSGQRLEKTVGVTADGAVLLEHGVTDHNVVHKGALGTAPSEKYDRA
jgi:hypothetical protein